jgi:hypothetical protein
MKESLEGVSQHQVIQQVEMLGTTMVNTLVCITVLV